MPVRGPLGATVAALGRANGPCEGASVGRRGGAGGVGGLGPLPPKVSGPR